MLISNSEVTLELLDEEYEVIADFVRRSDRIKKIKSIINKCDTNRNVKDFLLADDDRLNLLGLKLEAGILKTETKDLINKLIESFDIREYQIFCNNVDVHTVKLARAQYADIRDIVYNRIPVNRDIYDVNGAQIKISDIVAISERRIA